VALNNVDLTLPRGCVFGLLGENGAGKTTLIKHAMGLYRAQRGTVRVFGKDPVKDPEGALGHIGYLSEDRDIPRWMRVRELMRYTAGFYPKWDPAFADELLARFELDPHQKIRTCSMGQTAKTGLLVALAHRPDLVVLDEPSSGLDAVVRRHILHSAIRQVASEGRTVLFSSHLLDEVERVCDYVAIMNNGEVLLCDRLDAIKRTHHRFKLVFAEPQRAAPKISGALYCEGSGNEWSMLSAGDLERFRAEASELGARVHAEGAPTLEEIFLARIGSKTLEHSVS
jgi:ABC-2 type transport system ATP-binding protein